MIMHPVSSFCQDKNCKGNILPSQFEDPLSIPCLINLETSGLPKSLWITSLNGFIQDSPAIVAYTSFTTQLQSWWIIQPKPKLSFLSAFNLAGVLWTFAPRNPHSTNEHLSFVAWMSNDSEQINGFLMIQSMIFVISLWHSQLQMSLSLTQKMLHKSNNNQFSRQWKLNLMIMKVESTGQSCCTKTYLLDQNNHGYLFVQTKTITQQHS